MDWLTGGKPNESITNQGSQAWKAWRGKGLGSSDAAVLLGWSPWKTIEQLYGEKKGTWAPTFGSHQAAAMARGQELEPQIRKWYEEKRGHAFPDGIAEHPAAPYMRASFDGINRSYMNLDGSLGRIIEIKAPNTKDHLEAKLGRVPKKYIPQIQWLLLVGQVVWADYVSYGSDDTYATVAVKADEEIQTELIRRAVHFWPMISQAAPYTGQYFSEWKYPLKSIEATATHQIADQSIEMLVQETIKAQADYKKAELNLEILKEKLKAILGDQKEMTYGEATFGWQTRKGAIDYGKIEILQSIDLEPYRKKEVRAFYFKRGKNGDGV